MPLSSTPYRHPWVALDTSLNRRLAGGSLPRPPGGPESIPMANPIPRRPSRRPGGTGLDPRRKASARAVTTKAPPQEGTARQGRTAPATKKGFAAGPREATGKTAAKKAAPAKAARRHKAVPREGCGEQGGGGRQAGTRQGGAHQGDAGEGDATRSGRAKPSPVDPFDAKFLDGQRSPARGAGQLVGQAERFEAEAAPLMEDREPGDVQFDDESGEGDSLVVERERDLALGAQARQTVAEIDAALKRIEDGTYGLSVVSGRPIPKERLRALPWATELVEEKVAGSAPAGEQRVTAPAARGAAARGLVWSPWRSRAGRRRRPADQVVGGRALADGAIDVLWTLRFNLAFNSGMAFSRGEGSAGDRRRRHRRRGHPVALAAGPRRAGAVAVGQVVGGASGNLARPDVPLRRRVAAGEVIDFIDLHWWPVFNVADIAVVIGGILLVVSAWRPARRTGR